MSRLAFEIGTEAIPAGYMAPALAALQERAAARLTELRLGSERVRARGTPQRLVLEVEGLASRQEDLTRTVQGPRADIAFKDGNPTPAAEGFARKNGVGVDQLERVTTERGEFLQAVVHETGRPAEDVLPGLLAALVTELPWPKAMRWNDTGFLFPRPIRWVLCLLDDAVLPLEIAGLPAGRATRGHRLLGSGAHEVAAAAGLESVLQRAGVVLDPATRRTRIAEELRAAAVRLGPGGRAGASEGQFLLEDDDEAPSAGRVVEDPGLLDEVTFLAEHPKVHAGSFDPEFLQLPREVVVTAMRSHQRYFAVEDEVGDLLPNFLVVCDGDWEDASLVRAGNERVLRARLADARFYWDTDLKTGLEAMAVGLNKVVWLEKVGTLAEKSCRVAGLTETIGSRLFGESWDAHRPAAAQATKLAKADLASEMIKDGKEFTGLQGIMGARYAEASGEDPAVARALAEQYLPRGAEDPLPRTPVGTALALADRADSIAGCWAAGFVPSGSQDPYGLRRAGNGMVRILLEKELHLDLEAVLAAAVQALPEALRAPGLAGEIAGFLRERTAYFLRERGMSYDVVDAVLAAESADPLDALARARALQAVRGEPELEKLVIGFKRAANILKGVDSASLPEPARVDWGAADPAERDLHRAATAAGEAVTGASRSRDYAAMLAALLELRGPIDTFFDKVMVMAEDPAERGRRLTLLAEVRGLFDHLSDLSRIVIEGEQQTGA